MRKHWINITLVGILYGFSLPLIAEEGNYYRYKDKDGHIAISNTLPPEVANQGYEVISPLGGVIETVAPRENKEEIAHDAKILEKQKEEERKQKALRQQAQIQAHKDEILLKSFSSEADIVRSRDEKIASIHVLEEIVKDNITRLEKQLTDNKKMVDAYQPGQKIPESLQKNIDDTQRQIKENEAFLTRKQSEISQINTKYQKLIDRYKQLEVKTSTQKKN